MITSNIAGFNTESQFNTAIQYGTSGNANGKQEYIGLAPPGSALAESVWQIKKLTYNASGQLTQITWADGNAEFDQAFVNPETFDYS